MRRHQLLALLLLALAAASLLLLLQAEVEAGAEGSANYRLVLQKVASEANPKVCNHGEGPY